MCLGHSFSFMLVSTTTIYNEKIATAAQEVGVPPQEASQTSDYVRRQQKRLIEMGYPHLKTNWLSELKSLSLTHGIQVYFRQCAALLYHTEFLHAQSLPSGGAGIVLNFYFLSLNIYNFMIFYDSFISFY